VSASTASSDHDVTRLLTFAFVWLLVGFTTDTATLVGPVRWVASLGRAQGWTTGAERLAIVPLIGAFVVVSALISLWLARIVRESAQRHARIGIPLLCLVAAGGTLWLWMTPELMIDRSGTDEQVGNSFTFGAYPDEQRMRELRDQGYTAVVSLLHPLVVPFEPRLIAEGRAIAAKVGIGFVNVPMLPWLSDNAEALARIEQLAGGSNDARYYVHCYLGKDRVRLVRRVIEEFDDTARLSLTPELRAHTAARRLADRERLERGGIVQVVPEVFLTPYLTDNEIVSFVLPGTHGHVV